jgi:hypothetical protein
VLNKRVQKRGEIKENRNSLIQRGTVVLFWQHYYPCGGPLF